MPRHPCLLSFFSEKYRACRKPLPQARRWNLTHRPPRRPSPPLSLGSSDKSSRAHAGARSHRRTVVLTHRRTRPSGPKTAAHARIAVGVAVGKSLVEHRRSDDRVLTGSRRSLMPFGYIASGTAAGITAAALPAPLPEPRPARARTRPRPQRRGRSRRFVHVADTKSRGACARVRPVPCPTTVLRPMRDVRSFAAATLLQHRRLPAMPSLPRRIR